MSLFKDLYEGARKANAVTKPLSAAVKLQTSEGNVSMSAKNPIADLTEETPEGFAKLMESAEGVKISRKANFNKSTGSLGFTATGKYAASKYREFEGVEVAVPETPPAA